MHKQCRKCEAIKSTTEFHKHRSVKDGLQAYCKVCAMGMHRSWYAKHAEQRKQAAANYYANNREKMRAANRAWTESHPEKVKQYRKESKVRYAALHDQQEK